MSSAAPTNKVTVGLLIGAIVSISAWAVQYWAGIVVPAPVLASFTTVGVFVAQYYTRDSDV